MFTLSTQYLCMAMSDLDTHVFVMRCEYCANITPIDWSLRQHRGQLLELEPISTSLTSRATMFIVSRVCLERQIGKRRHYSGTIDATIQQYIRTRDRQYNLPGVSNMFRRYDLFLMSCMMRVTGIDRILTPR